MTHYYKYIDQFAERLTRGVIRWRWFVLLGMLALAFGIGSGARHLEFSSNYRVFFSAENPELQAFEELQATYTKNDNFLYVIEPSSGDAFDTDTLTAVESLTTAAWQIPFAIRVDSISNFQHTEGIDDDLIVEDLVSGAGLLDAGAQQRVRAIALSEPLLNGQLITGNGAVTAVNVVLQYPEKSLTEVPEAVAYARDIRQQIEADHPQLKVYLTGVSMLNNSFVETGMADMGTLVPLMFGLILLLTFAILRSASATVAATVVILLSVMVGMGSAGYLGINLTPISASAPIVILTLAIADSVHILIGLRQALREGMQRSAALVETLRQNFMPVTITSLTTVVGFLALNFSDSPPFWHLGNMTAIGIIAAWLFSLILLPALLSILPVGFKAVEKSADGQSAMESSAPRFCSRRARAYLVRKCTVSSTTMPSEMEATVATEKPTSPTSKAQAPKDARMGRPLGIRLSRPRLKLRNASIRISEITTMAATVPATMFCILRWGNIGEHHLRPGGLALHPFGRIAGQPVVGSLEDTLGLDGADIAQRRGHAGG